MTHTPLESSLQKKWIEDVPIAVTAGMDPARPVMIFKEKLGEERLPVWLSPLDAGIAITQDHVKANATSPHDLASKVFQQLQLKLEKCFFTEIKGHHQYVELHFSGNTQITKISTRADQAISFCLHEQSQFFCTKDFMQKCRELDAELTGFTARMKNQPGLGHNRHPYLMYRI
jgi:bifunctional DNase/RNase